MWRTYVQPGRAIPRPPTSRYVAGPIPASMPFFSPVFVGGMTGSWRGGMGAAMWQNTQRRNMGFFSELRKSLKDRAEGNKELAQSLEQLRDHEGLRKTKEGLEKVQREVGNKAAAAAQVGGEKLRESLSKVSQGAAQTWDTVREKAHLDQTLDKTKETLEKTKELLDATSQSVQKSSLYQATHRLSDRMSSTVTDTLKRLPLIEESKPTENTTSSGSNALVLRTDKVTNAMNAQIQAVGAKVRKTRVWKAAVDIKDRIITSENPLVQRGVEWSEMAAYYTKRSAKRMFGENERSKAMRAIHTLRPDFSEATFLNKVKTSILPDLRTAYLTNDAAALQSILVPAAYAELAPAVEEAAQAGYTSKSLLLDVVDAELAGAFLEDETNRPFIQINTITEESHCLLDPSGKVILGAEDDITEVHSILYMSLDETTSEWQVSAMVETHKESKSW